VYRCSCEFIDIFTMCIFGRGFVCAVMESSISLHVFQVRPGVVSVANRQNQLPTLLFKNGTVVPIQQASGQLIGHLISVLCGLEYSGICCAVSDKSSHYLLKMCIVPVL
jgi:hypothetical protein